MSFAQGIKNEKNRVPEYYCGALCFFFFTTILCTVAENEGEPNGEKGHDVHVVDRSRRA